MAPFYTRTGDDGTTGMLGEGRLPKHHARIEALGDLDEASAALGLGRSLSAAAPTAPLLVEVQRDLYRLMAEVAAAPKHVERFRSLDRSRLEWLEAQARALEALVQVPDEFILPGDCPAGAALSLARSVVRRAERRISALLAGGDLVDPFPLQYLNRLSSVCFLLELLENQHAGRSTSLAKKTGAETG
ncbi:MAG: cob(I)yrinic acid a,c-diamide adenosyltransferase [Anaerolineales bacterium]|nr:cob(I)yrinic acid a,c-diamide adenosyltransferase [Anaerolineales bacterium]